MKLHGKVKFTVSKVRIIQVYLKYKYTVNVCQWFHLLYCNTMSYVSACMHTFSVVAMVVGTIHIGMKSDTKVSQYRHTC